MQKGKECEVELLFSGIKTIELKDFNHGNIIFGIEFKKTDSGIKMSMDSSFGLVCDLVCQEVEVLDLKTI